MPVWLPVCQAAGDSIGAAITHRNGRGRSGHGAGVWAGIRTRTWSLSEPPYCPPQPPHPLSCCKFTMEPVPSPRPAPFTAPVMLPGSCLPFPTHPLLRSVARGQYGCQWHKTALLGGLGGLCARRHRFLRQQQGGIQLVLRPARTHPSAEMLQHQPCLGVTAAPVSSACPGDLLCPPSSFRAPPSFSIYCHNMPDALRLSKPPQQQLLEE